MISFLPNLLPYAAAVSGFALAVLVMARDVRSFIHQVLAFGLAMLALESLLTGFCLHSVTLSDAAFWMNVRHFPAAFLPGSWCVFTLCFSAKDPRGLLKKWKWVVLGLYAAPVVMLAGAGGSLLSGLPVTVGPGFWAGRINTWGMSVHACILVGAVLSLMLIERTLKNATGNFRWQIKFLMLGLGCIFTARIFTVSQILLFHAVRMEWELVNAVAILVGLGLAAKSLWRTYTLDLKLYVSHSVVYHSVSLLIIGAYFIVVSLAAKLFLKFNTTHAISVVSLVLVVSAAGALGILFSDRYRKKLRRFISRHFKRPLYDYRREWARFTHETSSAQNIHALSHAAAKNVSGTFDALAVTIWIKDAVGRDVVLGASTIFTAGGSELNDIARKLIDDIAVHPVPLELDWLTDELPPALEDIREDVAVKLEMRYCIPLRVKDNLVGVMTMGKRVGDAPLSVEDFDLLATMADQLAANVLNLLLSERLRDLKQMEAFQSMSAFFVHDLKNLANKLSLTVQNLPRHFEDPEFRKDAVRSISKSVDKIKGMSARLSSLSQKIELQKERIDLNELVSNTVRELNGVMGGRIADETGVAPRVLVDPDHFSKVITNLLLNALEASNGCGEIEIATGQQDGWIFVSVQDQGHGMPADFVEQSLFRPFQTTKKTGMGIGLYHSKTIVEAHGGKIEVESAVGLGSTFKVLLPAG